MRSTNPINYTTVKDAMGNVVTSGNYTQTGTYNLTFTPATTGTYTINYSMNHASYSCEFSVKETKISFTQTQTNLVCENLPSGGYRYGFNGMERDNEVKGKGNSYNYKARMFDPRVGRFLSIDPLAKKFPFYSPYQFAGNKPIIAIDLNGKEEAICINDPVASVKVLKAINAGDVQKAIHLALKAVTEGGAVIQYNGNFDGLRVNGHIQDFFLQNIFSLSRKPKEADSRSWWETLADWLNGNSNGGTSDRGGIMFTSSTGQNKGVKALDKSKVDGPINIDLLLAVLSATNSAAESKAETKILKIISGFLDAYEIGHSLREAYESKGTKLSKENNSTIDVNKKFDSTDFNVYHFGLNEGIETIRQSNSSIEKGESHNSKNSRRIKFKKSNL